MTEKRVKPNVKSNGTQGSGHKTKPCLEVVSLLSTKQKFILKTRIGATENSQKTMLKIAISVCRNRWRWERKRMRRMSGHSVSFLLPPPLRQPLPFIPVYCFPEVLCASRNKCCIYLCISWGSLENQNRYNESMCTEKRDRVEGFRSYGPNIPTLAGGPWKAQDSSSHSAHEPG